MEIPTHAHMTTQHVLSVAWSITLTASIPILYLLASCIDIQNIQSIMVIVIWLTDPENGAPSGSLFLTPIMLLYEYIFSVTEFWWCAPEPLK